VLLEAHGTTHFWARAASEWGHRGVLVPPHVVRRHVLVDKTERADAKGLLEAVRNEDVGPVPIESVKQQVLVSLHRMRSARTRGFGPPPSWAGVWSLGTRPPIAGIPAPW
jgi:transposase